MPNTNFKHIQSLNSIILNMIIYYLDNNTNFEGNLDKEFIYNSFNTNNNIPDTIDTISNLLSFDYQFKIFRNDFDTECLIASDNNNVFIIFSGLQQQDLLLDLKQILNYNPFNIPNTDFIVHSNFYNTFFLNNFFQNIINTILLFNPNNNKNIIISGHSAGSALSFIFSYLFNLSFPQQNIIIHNFGSIKFCNQSFYDFIYNNTHFEIFNVFTINDIAPIIPFEPFTNTNKPIFIIDNTIQCLENYNFNIFLNHSITSHFLNFYFNQITKQYLNLQ
jgi:hypothetical protein